MALQRAIVTHGGSESDPKNSDGPHSAARIGLDLMSNGSSSLSAVVHAVKFLEDDPRFNAGLGSQLREDGRTVQMDASCMTSDGEFGAVACVEGIQNPVELAHEVLHSRHVLIVAEGAQIFAKDNNITVRSYIDHRISEPQTNNDPPSCDTVGAVAFDGKGFAAALSSGGIEKSAIGRVGDVPLPGCGLFCGPLGAIACTGDGEYIALRILAREVYGWIEQHMNPSDAVHKAMTLFDDSVDVGLIVLTKNEFAANSRSEMAWSHLAEADL